MTQHACPPLPCGAVALRDEDVRQLLSTALRLRHGKAQSSLPEQLMAVFIQVGNARMS